MWVNPHQSGPIEYPICPTPPVVTGLLVNQKEWLKIWFQSAVVWVKKMIYLKR